jgi:hypothetical protein
MSAGIFDNNQNPLPFFGTHQQQLPYHSCQPSQTLPKIQYLCKDVICANRPYIFKRQEASLVNKTDVWEITQSVNT